MAYSNTIAMQRATLVRRVGTEVRDLYQEGYGVDADQLLDSLNEQRAEWNDGHANNPRSFDVADVQEHTNYGLAGGVIQHTILEKDIVV